MKTGVVNEIFWPEIGTEFGELGGNPTKNSQEYPLGYIEVGK